MTADPHEVERYEVRRVEDLNGHRWARCLSCSWSLLADRQDPAEFDRLVALHEQGLVAYLHDPTAVAALAQSIARATDRYEGEAVAVLDALAALGWRVVPEPR